MLACNKLLFDMHYIYLFIGHSSMLNEIRMYIGQNEFACHKQSQSQSVRSLLETIPSSLQIKLLIHSHNSWQPMTVFFFRVHMQFSKHHPPKCNYLIYRTYDVKFVKKCLSLPSYSRCDYTKPGSSSHTGCLWGRTAPSESLGPLGTQEERGGSVQRSECCWNPLRADI